MPRQAIDFLLIYAVFSVIALLMYFRRRPPAGMRLKMSRIEPSNERPLNVIFNYNGHSWDAYEVLGLPAGSPLEKVEQAYRESQKAVDPASKAFIEAAHNAIQTQWATFKKAK